MNVLFKFIFTVLFLYLINSHAIAREYKHVTVVTDTNIQITGEYITEIKFKEKGFTTNCSYPEVIQKLKESALENGANLMQITAHKQPDFWSSCHRISVALYKVANPRSYEDTITWSHNNKLTWDDFRAQPNNLTKMSAESSCGISYSTNRISLLKGIKYYVTTLFLPNDSWVNNEGINSQHLLNHEQKHFDIWEIYARRFYKELISNKKYSFSILHVDNLLFDIHVQCMKRQNEYDKETDHSRNLEMQAKWDNIIESELAELEEYANHY